MISILNAGTLSELRDKLTSLLEDRPELSELGFRYQDDFITLSKIEMYHLVMDQNGDVFDPEKVEKGDLSHFIDLKVTMTGEMIV